MNALRPVGEFVSDPLDKGVTLYDADTIDSKP